MKWVNLVIDVLVFVGALNWGLMGLFNYNLVSGLLGTGNLTKWVYVLVGVAAFYWAYNRWLAKGK